MHGLTTDLLSQACRTFLDLAYPGGETTIPPKRRPFYTIAPEQPLACYLEMREICERLLTPEGCLRGYAFCLGSARFPHFKLQVIDQGPAAGWVFTVDTHDALRCSLAPNEAKVWGQLQAENRRLKEQIETAWERQGLLTFNALLRRGLEKK
jgi:hypothetical protein